MIGKIYTLILVLLSGLTCISGNNFSFDRISTSAGLSNSIVDCIYQDNVGFMWFGTAEGLNKYDGYEFTVYKPQIPDSTSISHHVIHAVTEDVNGNLWIGTLGGGLDLYLRNSDSFKNYGHNPNNQHSISNNYIEVIIPDEHGNLWIGTFNGLNYFNVNEETFTRYSFNEGNPNSLSHPHVKDLYLDKNKYLWIGTWGGGLNRLNMSNGQFTHFNKQNQSALSNNLIRGIIKDKNNNIWFGTEGGGLNMLDIDKSVIHNFRHDANNKKSLCSDEIFTLFQDNEHRVWVGTNDGGISIFSPHGFSDPDSVRFQNISHYPMDNKSLSSNDVLSFYQDRTGIIWIGTYKAGLNKYDYYKEKFNYYYHIEGNLNSLSDNNVISIEAANKNEIWIGTQNGLNLFNFAEQTFQHFTKKNSNLPHNFVNVLLHEKDELWLGFLINGLAKLNTRSNEITFYGASNQEKGKFPETRPYCIEELNDSLLLIGTSSSGLIFWNKRNNSYKKYIHIPGDTSSLSNNQIMSIIRESANTYWIGTTGGGLNKMVIHQARPEFIRYPYVPGKENTVSSNEINCLFLDNKLNNNILWIGTNNGLNKYNPTTNRFNVYTEADGLSNNRVMSIINDNNDHLWIGTSYGMSYFNLEDESFKNYYSEDGLQGNEFTKKTCSKLKNGVLFFGGNEGFNHFHPDSIKPNPNAPETVITEFRIANKLISGNDSLNGRIILKKNITQTKKIHLKYKENSFSFKFAALHYSFPKKNKYKYTLEGYNEKWVVPPNGSRMATYMNLKPGHYVFRVKTANNDEIWNQTPAWINISIAPPIYKTWWAYVVYAVVIMILLFGFNHYSLIEVKKKNKLKLHQLEFEKQQQVQQMKLQFFTNISHEFRTPLTLILAPINELVKDNKTSKWTKEKLILIKQNAERLKKLINELMDFRKISMNKIQLHIKQGDMVDFLKTISDNFKPYVEQLNIELHFSTSHDHMMVWFDPEKLEKIIYNLLSNAVKYTGKNGKVRINLEKENPGLLKTNGQQEYVYIGISDTGKGIPKDKINEIFERFNQLADNHPLHKSEGIIGTGIGLALTRELVRLHKGTVEVSSEPGKGSCFRVKIPVGKDSYTMDEIITDETISTVEYEFLPPLPDMEFQEKNLPADVPSTPIRPNSDIVLFVEDNAELRGFLGQSLNEYRIIEAANGKIGFQMATKEKVDVIISDIMMPEMDGLELCKKLKSDLRTSHIPVILLTARSTVETNIEGLETGADVYLTKPFNMDVLRLNIANLLNNRQKTIDKIQRESRLKVKDVTTSSADEDFLNKILELIEQEISNPEFTVERFSSDIGLSSKQLYRKLKALTGLSPNEFIRNQRLKKAALLIEKSPYNISQIAYEVGFSDPGYFSTCFKTRFGVTPKEYASKY